MTVEGGKTGEGRIRKGSYAAPALDKAFLIIELLANHPQGMLVSEMATALGRSLGELFRIVVVMEEARYLEKSPIDDRYRVTYKFLDIAYRATPARQLTAAALPEMQSLALTVGQSCHLVVIEGGAGLVIAREENPGTRGFALRMGASIDIVASCSGKVLLAFAPPAQLGRIIDRAELAQGRPIGRVRLAEDLERVRAQGYELRESPITRGVTDISYPVFGFGGDCMAALTIPFLETIDGSQSVTIPEARLILAEATARISQQLGYRPDNGVAAS
ncbi:IclR family transcriptional regulator [Sphingomonas sanguinis]|jgi:DNA-binding IclR family transcriptional regulator|uniref:IclR family transcriptional regulator n=1 Tax=Sphingomonas sanguinis TaxID=33051 RepID=A0A7Y7QTR8_9SPHN|nr:IclR family transcriptional regulator [Sphingomonas sanguinis]MBZ6381185.1 IclR family transcriptional regulator [Sphingomonas sanguinis]NNG50259.1 IclR family transcriptional regulator [Sphingomonas sanguinis]NNG55160.1 IclR family transcriptional regulator [Sphingomonas sanguinis]NVP30488.1 IclR family transcriptional regulator [Sphingomonas sanguinis]